MAGTVNAGVMDIAKLTEQILASNSPDELALLEAQ